MEWPNQIQPGPHLCQAARSFGARGTCEQSCTRSAASNLPSKGRTVLNSSLASAGPASCFGLASVPICSTGNSQHEKFQWLETCCWCHVPTSGASGWGKKHQQAIANPVAQPSLLLQLPDPVGHNLFPQNSLPPVIARQHDTSPWSILMMMMTTTQTAMYCRTQQ